MKISYKKYISVALFVAVVWGAIDYCMWSSFLIGQCYSISVFAINPKNPEDFLARAEAGDALAQFNLGSAYIYPTPLYKQNYAEAAKWYLKAAMQGNAEAALDLSTLYKEALALNKITRKLIFGYFLL